MPERFAINIKKFLPINLLEGEGIGQTYEYFIKWRLLNKFFAEYPLPQNILIAGLPQKYGSSLDLLMFANFYNIPITICDEREEAVRRYEKLIFILRDKKILNISNIKVVKLTNFSQIDYFIKERFDFIFNSEVLQRLMDDESDVFINKIRSLANFAAFFVPNGRNSNHNKISGLRGLKLEDLEKLFIFKNIKILAKGYLDIPPFPPGLRQSDKAREAIRSSLIGKAGMKTLEIWGRGERLMPGFIKSNRAHIIYFILDLRKDG